MSSRSALSFGLLALSLFSQNLGRSAEIKVLSANVFTGVLDSQFSAFARTSGHKVSFIYETAGKVRNHVQAGEPGDVAIVTKTMMDELESAGKIAPGTAVNVARSAVSLVIRRGAAKPDIGSVEAFRRALLAAHSISYPDSARGGATGVLFTKILDRLGLAAEVKTKAIFPSPGHFAVGLVANGEVEVAIAQPMEALLQPGVEIVGLLPSELQDPPSFTFAAGQMAAAKEPDAARSLIQYLVGPEVQAEIKGKGMEPGTAR